MWICCKNLVLVISLLLLTSCSSAEYKEALRLYELAQSSKNIHQLTNALSTLAKIAPETYQAEFIKVESAKKQLEQAQNFQAKGDNYSAYLTSHDSYRSVPSADSKKILISSGKTLFPFLKAQFSIDKSFQRRPQDLTALFKKYNELPIKQWNLIEVNNAVEQLSKAVIELNSALALIENDILKTKVSEVSLWQTAIENQIDIVVKARDYFSNLARYRSANILIKLNKTLTIESIKLLSLVRPKFAKESMQSSFLKANSEYEPFQNIMVNVSLAENLSAKDIHVFWYQSWKDIEVATLEPEGVFSNYPIKSQNRKIQLLEFLDKSRISVPLLTENFYSQTVLKQKIPQLTMLTNKLKEDKALL